MEELKAHWGKYVLGAVIGAIVILILGFWVGPLTTNGSAAAMATAAATDRDSAYCVANARKLVASGEQAAPTTRTERTDLARASFVDLLPDATTNNAAVRDCVRAFPQQF